MNQYKYQYKEEEEFHTGEEKGNTEIKKDKKSF